MRILVTGGFGYLGGRIAQSLSTEGHKIVLGSRTKQQSPRWLPDSDVVQIEWSNPECLLAACGEIDVIVHTAGMNAQDCLLDPKRAIEFNGKSTEKLVKASIDAKVSKFIYLSTAHVYCSPLHGEITEESPILNKHPYALSHKIGEDAILFHSKDAKNFEGVILRLSNGVGVPLSRSANCWMLAVNDFCRQAMEIGTIEINSPSAVERDFFPIELLCKTINSIIFLDNLNENIINVSSSRTKSLLQIIEIITKRAEKLFGFNPEIVFKNNDLISNKANLKILNNKLRKIVKVEDSLELEIDQLLLKCNEWFGNE